MPQFVEVVRQHILSVVGNVIHSFVENLTDFLRVRKNENRLTFDEIIVTVGWRVFQTQCTLSGTCLRALRGGGARNGCKARKKAALAL